MDPTAPSPEGRDEVKSAIVDAAARLLSAHGLRAVTTRRVAETAGVQAPTIYRFFGDKHGLLDAVAEQVLTDYVGARSGSPDTAPAPSDDPLEALRAGWSTTVAFGLANPDVFHLLIAPERAVTSPAAAAGRDVLRRLVHRLAPTRRLRLHPDRAAEMIHAAATGVILSLLAQAPEDRDPELAPTMLETVLAAVVSEGSAIVGSDRVGLAAAFADVVPELEGLSPAERTLLLEWLGRSMHALQRAGA